MSKGERKEMTPVTLEMTVHVGRLVRHTAYKRCAPRAIRDIKKRAQSMMKTKDVRIDPSLNEAIFSRGIRYPPRRLRVRLSRKRNEAEDSEEKFYTLVSHVECANFKGLNTEHVQE
eukprot:Blabericola_migrator_1__2860@NODE_181_length_11864_cov_121_034161_g157_i0_p9_GENE_NODE_181_length_11864_cov_121_034161_g157_i0NODE_181_length_11864_cov_121_034161_g157_i0_p9_ORF_typecomplete_len116_score13_18Ribosomal_L31e/PF01198_19/7_4e28LolA_like/PF17131_4/0_01_NODE_181_length_11864_cov_121_034161_g157_i01140011747